MTTTTTTLQAISTFMTFSNSWYLPTQTNKNASREWITAQAGTGKMGNMALVANPTTDGPAAPKKNAQITR
jgi:hypothetical protein